ncbi:glycosyltransferase family 39 protein [Streptomyces sp. cg28]|uniref:glycosyltransferase family 39 protein n=1 Tax=Streptomyces sp. cg28 TaxID=3403457 RepID=UPI003B210FCD
MMTSTSASDLEHGMATPDLRHLERRYRQTLAALLVAVTVALGTWSIGRDGSSWRDETVSYAVGRRSVGELWHLLHNIDAVHGLYYFLAHLVLAVRDDGIVSLRAVSVAGTVAAVLGVNAIGRLLDGPQTGFLSGLAFLCVPQVQFYLQEARSYALVAASVVWATWFLLRALHDSRRVWWCGYAGLLVWAGWLHEFALLVLLAHGITVWRGGRLASHGKCWLAAGAVAGALVSPLAVISARQAEAQLDWLGRPGLGEWLAWGIPALLAVALSVRPWWRGSPQAGPAPGPTGAASRPVGVQAVALPLLIAPAGFLLVVSFVHPWYVDRYVLYCWAGLALVIGYAVRRAQFAIPAMPDSRRRRRVVRCAVACALAGGCVLGVAFWQERLPASRVDTMEGFWGLTANAPGERTPILFQPARRRAWILGRPAYEGPVDDVALGRTPQASGTLYGVEAPPRVIRERMLRHPELIVLRDRPDQPQDRSTAEITKRSVLREYFQLCWVIPLHGGEWTIYVRRDRAVSDPLCAPGRHIYS